MDPDVKYFAVTIAEPGQDPMSSLSLGAMLVLQTQSLAHQLQSFPYAWRHAHSISLLATAVMLGACPFHL